jgi:polysaccharide export outer membrane protein
LCTPLRRNITIRKEEAQVNTLQSTFKKLFAFVVVLISALTIAGCASTSTPVVDQTPPPQQDYLIGPGDNVNIIVWRNAEVSLTVPVRPDGKISTPLVEDLPASGKTPTELARDVEKALARYIQQPVVTVIVTGFVGTYNEQIRVIGQAAKPQSLPYRRDMSLMDVMIAVGGVTEFASGNRASIIRTVDGKEEKLPVRINDLIKRGDISANVRMLPGDILVIPESFF